MVEGRHHPGLDDHDDQEEGEPRQHARRAPAAPAGGPREPRRRAGGQRRGVGGGSLAAGGGGGEVEAAAGAAAARAAAGRPGRSSPKMLLDLGERRNLARGAVGAVAVEQQVRDPARRRAGDVLGGRVADVQRLARRAPGELERGGEDRRVGLARAGGRRGDDPVEQRRRARSARSTSVQRDVPVGDADEGEPALSQPVERRRRVGVGAKADRGDQLSRRSPSRPSSRVSSSAQAARRRPGAGLVAGLVGVLAVVGHLGAQRGDHASRRARSRARRPGGPRAARARPACRARRRTRLGRHSRPKTGRIGPVERELLGLQRRLDLGRDHAR